MITIIPIEPVNDEHSTLIVEAFNRYFIHKGGKANSNGYGAGYGNGYGTGYGNGNGHGCGSGYGDSNGGSGDYDNGNVPKEWRTE